MCKVNRRGKKEFEAWSSKREGIPGQERSLKCSKPPGLREEFEVMQASRVKRGASVRGIPEAPRIKREAQVTRAPPIKREAQIIRAPPIKSEAQVTRAPRTKREAHRQSPSPQLIVKPHRQINFCFSPPLCTVFSVEKTVPPSPVRGGPAYVSLAVFVCGFCLM